MITVVTGSEAKSSMKIPTSPIPRDEYYDNRVELIKRKIWDDKRNGKFVEPDEPVRCCDCRYYFRHLYVCLMHSVYNASIHMLPDDYCNYGERKENE